MYGPFLLDPICRLFLCLGWGFFLLSQYFQSPMLRFNLLLALVPGPRKGVQVCLRISNQITKASRSQAQLLVGVGDSLSFSALRITVNMLLMDFKKKNSSLLCTVVNFPPVLLLEQTGADIKLHEPFCVRGGNTDSKAKDPGPVSRVVSPSAFLYYRCTSSPAVHWLWKRRE